MSLASGIAVITFDRASTTGSLTGSHPTSSGPEGRTAQITASLGISQFPVVDMTKQTAVTIDITHAPANATCQPACYAIVDPKHTGQEIISPNVKVKLGTTITWVNKDTTTHTVTSIMGENPGATVPANIFDSGAAYPLAPGQSFVYKVYMDAYAFNSNHIVVYYCRFHPSMVAAITVTQ